MAALSLGLRIHHAVLGLVAPDHRMPQPGGRSHTAEAAGRAKVIDEW